MKRVKRSGWEYFTICCMVVCSLLMSLTLYAKRDQVFKERLMHWDLLALRNYTMAYMLEHRRYPSDLNVLKEKWDVKIFPKQDPFGRVYQYDAKTGWVSSGTGAYRQW